MKPNLQKSHISSFSHLTKHNKTLLFGPTAATPSVSQLTEQPVE